VPAVPPLLRDMVAAAGATASAPARGELRRALDAAPPARRGAMLLAHLDEGLRRALGLDGRLDPQRGFADLGLDSLAALELKKRLEADLDRALPATLLLDYPTLARLRDFLLDEPAAELAAPPPPSDDALEAEIAALDDAELLARIARKYDRWVG
jgi:myxalamid-type polyketide synthase MxaE and MxaD